MRVSITGFNSPGGEFCRPDGSPLHNVHVGIQIRREPAELVNASLTEATWSIDVNVTEADGELDFKGPAVQGTSGDRFVYLTWGNVERQGDFEMFRRAKLMLNRVDIEVMRSAVTEGELFARVDLTGRHGHPVAGRVDPPAIEWSSTPL